MIQSFDKRPQVSFAQRTTHIILKPSLDTLAMKVMQAHQLYNFLILTIVTVTNGAWILILLLFGLVVLLWWGLVIVDGDEIVEYLLFHEVDDLLIVVVVVDWLGVVLGRMGPIIIVWLLLLLVIAIVVAAIIVISFVMFVVVFFIIVSTIVRLILLFLLLKVLDFTFIMMPSQTFHGHQHSTKLTFHQVIANRKMQLHVFDIHHLMTIFTLNLDILNALVLSFCPLLFTVLL